MHCLNKKMSLVVTVSRALVFSDASLMPQRRLIELVISSYLTGYWRKISLRPLSDCFSPGTKIKSPVYSGIKPFPRNFQFQMVLDRGVFYHPSYLLSILMSYSSGCNHKQLAVTGRTTLLELLVTQMTLSFWLPLPQHCD